MSYLISLKQSVNGELIEQHVLSNIDTFGLIHSAYLKALRIGRLNDSSVDLKALSLLTAISKGKAKALKGLKITMIIQAY